METLASEHAFEEAKRQRDWIRAAEHARLPQVVELDIDRDLDVIWAAGRSASILAVRGGDTVGLRHVRFRGVAPAPEEPKREVIGNAGAAGLLPDVHVSVPRSARSRDGQLLEIVHLNHAYHVSGG